MNPRVVLCIFKRDGLSFNVCGSFKIFFITGVLHFTSTISQFSIPIIEMTRGKYHSSRQYEAPILIIMVDLQLNEGLIREHL